ncbi:MAG: hypothetical protein VR72_13310 [Clostridiaceae bacterium BRH_c20a]|nr:MAG: hypothetical protein VR72_13310 [Clostridiaceae bacterium BRH_c20a]
MNTFINFFDLGQGAVDISLLILRIVLAWVFWVHAWHKSYGRQGYRGSGDRFKVHNIPYPYAMAYFVSISQLIGAPLLLVGFLTRWLALLFVGEMLVGAYCKYKEERWFNSADLPLSLAGIFLLLIFLGAGPYSIDALF